MSTAPRRRTVNWCDVGRHAADPDAPLYVVGYSGVRLRHGTWGYDCGRHGEP